VIRGEHQILAPVLLRSQVLCFSTGLCAARSQRWGEHGPGGGGMAGVLHELTRNTLLIRGLLVV